MDSTPKIGNSVPYITIPVMDDATRYRIIQSGKSSFSLSPTEIKLISFHKKNKSF